MEVIYGPQNLTMKARTSAALLALLLFAPMTQAVTLLEADSLWLFDGGTVGTNATYTQVIDSSANAHAVSSSNFNNLSWVTVPSTGPYGGTAQSSDGHGLQFTPVVTVSNAGAANADTVSAATLQSINASISGSSTMITRMRWDGAISGLDDNTNQWIVSNGFGGWSEPDLASKGYMFGLTTSGGLYYYTAAANTGIGQTASGASHTFTPTGLTLTVGEWYDIAMVLNDFDDGVKTTGQVTFYVVGSDGQLQTFTSNATTWVSPTSNTTLQLGGESAGTGTSNQRKSFNGAMDYLAMYDTALSQEEVTSIFAAPEPSRGLLLLGGVMLASFRRRRNSAV